MRVATIDQVGIVVADLTAAMDAYVSLLGAKFAVFDVDERISRFSGSSARFQTRFAISLGPPLIELIQPVTGTTIHSQHLESSGAGIHHLGLHVPSLAQTKRRLVQKGYEILMEGEIEALDKVAYFQPPGAGCVVEALQLFPTLPLFLRNMLPPIPKSCHSSTQHASPWLFPGWRLV
jgi:hypothetical protein